MSGEQGAGSGERAFLPNPGDEGRGLLPAARSPLPLSLEPEV